MGASPVWQSPWLRTSSVTPSPQNFYIMAPTLELSKKCSAMHQ